MKSLADLYREHDGKVSDKWELYIDAYEGILAPYRSQSVSLLEIGIQNGGSLEIWEKYFPNFQKIIGCDIDPKCALLTYENSNVKVIVGDANGGESRKKILEISSSFDIVIDDGSHLSSDIIKSFLLYFPALKEGGIFIAEDLHCSYWLNYEGGIYHPYSSISFFKRLADILNFEHWGNGKARVDLLKGFFSEYGVSVDEDCLSHIHSVEFINSICIIKKASKQKNMLGIRRVVGAEDTVVALDCLQGKGEMYGLDVLHIQLNNMREIAPDEIIMHMEKLLKQSLEDTVELNEELVQRDNAISGLNKEIVQRENAISGLNKEIVQRDNAIKEIFSSKSWRITSPLRRVSYYYSKMKSKFILLSKKYKSQKLNIGYRALSIKKELSKLKSPMHLVSKVIFFLKNNGFQGLKNKIMNIGGFDESQYLLGRPDVAEAVARGEFISGLEHFLIFGAAEGAVVSKDSYSKWLSCHELEDKDIEHVINKKLQNFHLFPLISVVMPTFNTKVEWLIEAIESVRKQSYPHWELCIADDASTDKKMLAVLHNYVERDNRIKVIFRDQNGHISNSSNSALELAKGEWVALLDHDDVLNRHALFWTVDAINENPHAHLIYSDEDKIDGLGARFDPYFKPDWNRDLLYSQNYFSHLGVYRKQLIDEVGGFRIGFEGSQDYDLLLRCIEKIDARKIHHIPRVLYHWRAHDMSTALSADTKPYAIIAGERALNEHFNRMGIKGYAEAVPSGYRAHYDLPKQLPLVSLIIPTKNAHALVRNCIESIVAKTSYLNYEIILVDNNSDESQSLQYFDQLAGEGVVNLLKYPHAFNYSAINNFAVTHAKGEIIGLINNDIEVISPEWLSEMVSLVGQEGVGAVGAKLLYPDGRLQHGGVILGLGGIAGHSHHLVPKDDCGYFGRAGLISSYSAVTAACLLVKKSNYQQVGGLNEQDLTVAFNDVDFCLRLIEAGYRNIYTPYALLYHHESATRGAEDSLAKVARFNSEIKYMAARWGDMLSVDPGYSPNLSLDHHGAFRYAWPPRI
jgi:GT2 family glycosyltransferase